MRPFLNAEYEQKVWFECTKDLHHLERTISRSDQNHCLQYQILTWRIYWTQK
jgi:hypothetical protein